MVTASEVTSEADKACGERVFLCHDSVCGFKANIRLYKPGYKREQDKLRAVAIAIGHFEAKARAEAKAL